MKHIILFVIFNLISVNLINCEPEPSYDGGIPNILSRQQPNNIQGLPQQQQQQQQSGFIQMYRSDSKYMNQMITTTEPNHFNSAASISYQSQTAYTQPQQQQQQLTYPPQQNNQQQTTFEIQPSYGYDLGSIQQQESTNNQQQQPSVGHDIYGSPIHEKSIQINLQQELNTGESLLHPQSTPFYSPQNNQYIPPAPSSSTASSPPPPAPTQQQELPLPPTSYSSQPIFNPQPIISNDLPPPLSALNAPPPSSLSSPSSSSAPSGPQSNSISSLYDDNSYQPTGYDSTDGYYPPAKQTVHKHIYVHIPPREFDEEAPRQHFKVPRAEKHYKIIFIKTPTPPQSQPILPPIPQNEEKTLIYVLHKKPEEPEDITIPTPEPTQPSKPEVYFIKYKTQNNIPALYGAPTAPTEEDASAAAGEHSYPPISSSSIGDDTRSQHQQQQIVEPRNTNEQIGNNNVADINSNLYNSTITTLHRYF